MRSHQEQHNSPQDVQQPLPTHAPGEAMDSMSEPVGEERASSSCPPRRWEEEEAWWLPLPPSRMNFWEIFCWGFGVLFGVGVWGGVEMGLDGVEMAAADPFFVLWGFVWPEGVAIDSFFALALDPIPFSPLSLNAHTPHHPRAS